MQTLKKIALGIACAFGALMCLALFIGIVTGGTKNTTSKPDAVVAPAPPVATQAPIVTPAPYFPKTQSPPPPAPAPIDKDALYKVLLNAKSIKYDSWAEALDDASAECGMFRIGHSFEEVGTAHILVNPHNFSGEQLGWQIGAAVGSYCPEFTNRLPHNN